MSLSKEVSFVECVRMALHDSLASDSSVRVFGLGVPDPKGVFGSTLGLQEIFGKEKVFDIPLSENAITGFALGLAMCGLKPVLNHQRADFAFTSMEQIVNQVSKLNYTSNGRLKAQLVLRMIVGRGWGQGPTHAQSPHSLYSTVPGLRVVMPATPQDAYWLTRHSIEDYDPVIIIEHRWLHQVKGSVDTRIPYSQINKSETLLSGNDITIFSMSYGVLESLRIAEILSEFKISASVVNLRSISPLDINHIVSEVDRTKRAAVIDVSHPQFGVSSEISSIIHENFFESLKKSVLRLGNVFEPTPSAPFLAKQHYANIENMTVSLNKHFNFGISNKQIERVCKELFPRRSAYDDQPEVGSVGPF